MYVPPICQCDIHGATLLIPIIPCDAELLLVVVGDFNLPHIDWLTLQGLCPSEQAFCDRVFECNLSQLVCQPTHIAGNSLDLILTTEPAVIETLRVHSASDCPLSTDHFLLSFGLQGEASSLQHSSCTTPVVFDYSKANWDRRAMQLPPGPGL